MFGCRVFVHILKDEQSHLNCKAKQYIFLGYAKKDFNYKLWDLVKKKVLRSKDVMFFEDKTFDNLDETKKPKVLK